MRRWLVFGWIFLCGAAAMAEPPVKVASIEGVTEYRLANGARVLLFPETSRPTVTVNMTVLVGSRHEGYGESGMAHLLEHMVFKGTPDHPLHPQGAPRSRGQLQRHHQRRPHQLLRDHARHRREPRVRHRHGIRPARQQLRQGRGPALGDDGRPQRVRTRREQPGLDPQPADPRRGLRVAQLRQIDTIGNRSDIERVPIENLQAFYKKYYQPDNVVLIVAGKFEEAKALALAGEIPRLDPEARRASWMPPTPRSRPRTASGSVTLRRVGAVGSVGVAYHVPSASQADWAPLSLLGGIISQSPNGRLYKALVESKLATNASARSDNAHDPGLFFASASCEPEKLDAVRDALVEYARIARRRALHRRRSEQGEGPQQAERRDAAIEQPGDVAGAELGVEPRRLAAAVHPARPGRRRDRGRRQPRGEDLFPEAQSHGRRLHPDQGIDAAGRCPPPPRSTWS